MLFDTDVIIWALRRNDKAVRKIDSTEVLQISAVTYMELLKGARDKQELRNLKKTLQMLSIEVIPISENISHRAMIYIEEYGLSSGMDLPDALIAATAVENDFTLCTANDKHYKVISNIELDTFRP
jgi:predicted nucleic acid-binding protein